MGVDQGGKAGGSSKGRWLTRLRKPKEVKETLAALETIRGRFDTSDVYREGAITPAFATVRNTVESDPNRAVHSITHDGWKPTDLALSAVIEGSLSGGIVGRIS
jgi:hypothetical protein